MATNTDAIETPARRSFTTVHGRMWRLFRSSVRNISTAALLLVLLLLIARALLPFAVKRYVNDTLNRIPGYAGYVEDIDLHLWRGAYRIKGAALMKSTGKISVPFLKAPLVDLSVQWRELWNGALVGEIEFDKPQLNFVFAKTESRSQTTIDKSFQERVQDLFPFQINRFKVNNGEVRFRAPERTPPVDVQISDVQIAANNLTNSLELSKTLHAYFDFSGRIQSQAPVKGTVALDPYATVPTFDLDLQMQGLQAKSVNDLFISWGNFDVEKGRIDLYGELASSKNGFRGYVKPILTDIEIISLERDSDNPIALVWQSLVGALVEIFTNQRRGQFAADIPLRGTFASPETSTWTTLVSIVTNAFIEALKPAIDNSVTFERTQQGSDT